ncbi:hypothetical protein KTS45_00100 [Halomicroarcula limicola]|uniref:Rpa-associated protein n=1 Tax=Haloarcula limicola TaxID=1429915 RepID=A0A8J7Y5R1_9EURY|nr:hypothetical protein [Halomicroarcula limicola]MBV0922591.1 hypothetical protein [Halomicroarcula limicola]
MSESDDGGPGRREVAHRLFAAEFDDADFSYSESDEERAPNYVVTPTGARVNRLFAVGVLTEIEQVNEEVLRARIVDPTGPFVVYAGQYQPDALAFLESTTPPLFVAITGKARTFEPEDGDRVFTSIRPESISEVDAGTRDRWVVQAAEQTVERIGHMASAKQSDLAGDDLRASLTESGVEESLAAGIPLALEHYGTTGDYLEALRDLSLDAARVVAGEVDEAGTLSLSPGDGTDDPLPVLAGVKLESDVAAAAAGDESDGAAEVEAASPSDAEPSVDSGASDDSEPSVEAEPTDDSAAAAESADTESMGTADATPDEGETVEPTEPESEDAPTETDTDVGTAGEFGGDETEIADSSDAATESSTADEGADDADADDEVGDFDTEFELDEGEREEIEAEYGTDFQSGSEVDEPGEADIDTPDPEELAEAEAGASEEGAPADAADAEPAPNSPGAPAGDESPEPDAEAATSDAPAETPETATEAGADETTAGEAADAAEEPDAEDVDLEDAVMDVMRDLDDGDGADREEIRATVVEEYGADSDAVEDAIQDALMSGQCYEPEDGKLTPI